jgi:hypothetical protein
MVTRSSVSRMSRLLLVLLLTASSALAQERQLTAYDALKVVGKQVSRVALGRVISVTGVDGDPQPTRWSIVVVDRHAPEGVREFQVANGRVVADGPPSRAVVGSTTAATVKTAQLNLDSSGAFSVASYTANTAHVNFSFVSYTLRTNERSQPVWVVTLQDDARRPLGTVTINASRGNVTRVQGMFRGANMAHVEQDPAERGRVAQQDVPRRDLRRRDVEQPDDQPAASDDEYAQSGDDESIDEGEEDENVVKAEIKRMFRHTKDGALRIFDRARRPFDEFFNR